MSAGWIAGNVRGRLLLERRLGDAGIAAIAGCRSLDDALALLDRSAYGPFDEVADLATAQRQVAARTLLRLRTLAGWLPRAALEVLRALGAWFELVNVEDRLAYLHGDELRSPFALGALSTSGPLLARAQTPRELRDALRASPWGDPGGEEPDDVHVGLRLAWAQRVLASVPEAGAWAAGALALLLAREVANGGIELSRPAYAPVTSLGVRDADLATVESLRAGLPEVAAWALRDVEGPGGLWQAECAWWRAVEVDAATLVRGPLGGRGVVVGVVALLGVDAARTAAALGAAARGGERAAREAIDALL